MNCDCCGQKMELAKKFKRYKKHPFSKEYYYVHRYQCNLCGIVQTNWGDRDEYYAQEAVEEASKINEEQSRL